MNTYTVKEISDMLKTNPETVRRWIRLGKIEADQSSRKGGNVVSEQSLNAGVPILTATLLGTMVAQKSITEERLKNAQISVSEMLKFIDTSIKSSEKTISAKKEEISKLELEIIAEENHVKELKALKEKLKSRCSQASSDREEK